jgi:hypothetical protein
MRKIVTDHQRKRNHLFIYPHSAIPNLFNDFPGFEPYPHIDVQFVTAPGHMEVLRAMDYPNKLDTIGWYLCPMLPFAPRAEARRILFAPIHPQANGSLSPVNKQNNINAYKKLLRAQAENDQLEITVRFLYGLENSGLWYADGIRYIEGKPDQSYGDIDEADVVIGYHTFAYIAIARGVPTITLGEDFPPSFWYQGVFQYVRSWEKCKELMRYPFDILGDMEPMELFRRAIQSDDEILDWKRRMIGEPFNDKKFVAKVEKYL